VKPRYLLAITPLVVLWVRQVRFEKRSAARQLALEAECCRFAEEVNDSLRRASDESIRWGEALGRALGAGTTVLHGDDFAKAVRRAASTRTPGGARR
jgi:hypothetical protein